MDQQHKFNSKSVWQRIKPLLCCVLSLGMSSSLFADPGLSQPSASKSELVEQPAKDRLAPLKARLAKQYPDVEHLSIDDYLADHPQAVLVDVRAAEEYAVSRIPGAVHIEDRGKLLAFARKHADAQIILYCSVGARSAEAARFLQDQGKASGPQLKVGKVANLAGSIFQWSNEKRPLENEAGSTSDVHPFNAWWGWRYLD